MGAVASVIFKMYVFLGEIVHLAVGAEWEPSGAGTRTCRATSKSVCFGLRLPSIYIGAVMEASGSRRKCNL